MKNKEISDEKFEEVLDSIEDLEKIEENKKNDEEIVEKTEGFFESFKKKNSKNEKLQEEINNLKDQNLRIYADFENVKRRLKEDNIRQMKFANEKFAFDILDILDTLELSLQYISVEKEKEGIVNTISKFKNILSNYNITEVSYEVFSPNEHEAINVIEVENKKTDEIVEVYKKGYKIHDKLLRSAMVSIAK